MNQIGNSLVSGQIPAASPLNPGDIAVNNADGAIYVLKQNGSTKTVVSIGGITSFNNRTGDIILNSGDVTTALGYTPIGTNSPVFTGTPIAPTPTVGSNSTQIATTAFVHAAISAIVLPQVINKLSGLNDVNVTEAPAIDGYALTYSNASTKWIATKLAPVAISGAYTDLTGTPALAVVATSGSYNDLLNKPAAYSLPIATVSNLGGVKAGTGVNIAADGTLTVTQISTLAGLSDVSVTEGPTIDGYALTFNNSSAKWKASALATVAFSGKYSDLIGTPTAGGVTSFNTRTGAVTLQASDVTGVGGALLASPTFTGVPAAPTATAGTNTTQLATTAFVTSAIATVTAGSVTSFNARSGAVTLQASDVTGVGGALLASPTFTGIPAAPTATAGTNTTQIATTAFVTAAVTAGSGVTAFNSRTGSVTLTSGDIGSAGGALLASPTFTGTPKAPTATAGTNTTQLATTAFVTAAVTASTPDLSSYAPLASPALTGTPTAPTATAGTNTTQVATTAFVQATKYYDVVGGAVGAITASQLMTQFVSGRTVTFPAGLTNSQGYASTVPTASTTFTITANGVNVGTMVFAAGSHTATFTASSSFSLSPGQLLIVTGPASADATIATVSFTLLGLAS